MQREKSKAAESVERAQLDADRMTNLRVEEATRSWQQQVTVLTKVIPAATFVRAGLGFASPRLLTQALIYLSWQQLEETRREVEDGRKKLERSYEDVIALTEEQTAEREQHKVLIRDAAEAKSRLAELQAQHDSVTRAAAAVASELEKSHELHTQVAVRRKEGRGAGDRVHGH